MKILRKIQKEKRLKTLNKRSSQLSAINIKQIKGKENNFGFLIALSIVSLIIDIIFLKHTETTLFFLLFSGILIVQIFVFSIYLNELLINSNRHLVCIINKNKIDLEIHELEKEKFDVSDFYEVYLNDLIKLRVQDDLDKIDINLINSVLNEKRKNNSVKKISNNIVFDSFINNEYINAFAKEKETNEIKIT